MTSLVTGAAGLIGSHLCDQLIARGESVIGIDDLSTGRRSNLEALERNPSFQLIEADVADLGSLVLDETSCTDGTVYHLASPASPSDFRSRPLAILRAGSLGTFAALEFAARNNAPFVFASTSEVYGDPLVHPQPETYWGNVHSTGPRACYDESKRFGEALVSTYARELGLRTSIARIFNTYGPRMRTNDGRVVSNFVVQALRGEPLTVHGDGLQTRSFCFVEDQARGLIDFGRSNDNGPTNIGSTEELSVIGLAEMVIELTGSTSTIEFRSLPEDDPSRRRPDVTRAESEFGWQPLVSLRDGLLRTIEFFERLLLRRVDV